MFPILEFRCGGVKKKKKGGRAGQTAADRSQFGSGFGSGDTLTAADRCVKIGAVLAAVSTGQNRFLPLP
jgi:hypothetical protein